MIASLTDWPRLCVISVLAPGAFLLAVIPGLTRQADDGNPPQSAQERSIGRVETPALKHDFLLRQRDSARQELLQVQAELRKLRAETNVLRVKEKSFADVPIPESTIEEALKENAEFIELVNAVDTLRESLESKSLLYRDGKKHPIFKEELQQLADQEKELTARLPILRSQCVKQQREKAREEFVQSRIAPLEERMAVLKELERILISDIGSLEAKFGSTRPAADALERRVDRLEELLDQLGKAIAELRMSIKKGS